MDVRGVRRSWETARSRLARIFSRSLSARIFSCCLILVVSMPVSTATISITAADSTFSGIEKLNSK